LLNEIIRLAQNFAWRLNVLDRLSLPSVSVVDLVLFLYRSPVSAWPKKQTGDVQSISRYDRQFSGTWISSMLLTPGGSSGRFQL
jgi:hypothetical protein